MAQFGSVPEYSGNSNAASWEGTLLPESVELREYFATRVQERLEDLRESQRLHGEMLDLATTGLATEKLEAILSAGSSTREPWEVGEAFSECILEDREAAIWPWNMERDKRTPRASLPGADLIGFVHGHDGAWLAIGEVKTSSDENSPPQVMYGRHGMVQQLERFVDSMELQATVFKWLAARCRDTDHWPTFQAAVRRFLETEGRAVVLFGVLMRDTAPVSTDLSGRGVSLGDWGQSPTKIRLRAWYAPWKCEKWHQACLGDHNE